jgi:hypothetical protein
MKGQRISRILSMVTISLINIRIKGSKKEKYLIIKFGDIKRLVLVKRLILANRVIKFVGSKDLFISISNYASAMFNICSDSKLMTKSFILPNLFLIAYA